MASLSNDDIDRWFKVMESIRLVVPRQIRIGQIDQLEATVADKATDLIAANSASDPIASLEELDFQPEFLGATSCRQPSEPGSYDR
jgi:hypothetical protein